MEHRDSPGPGAPRLVPGLPPDIQPAARRASLGQRLRGPWRIAVAEASMLPAIHPGDWLLVDPTIRRWPRAGSLVVFREPDTDVLSIKRVAGRPGDWVAFEDGYLHLEADEAWLLSDATPEVTAAAGFGPPFDSRRFGPVPVELLVGRAWFRYAPLRRVGRVPTSRSRPVPKYGAERSGSDVTDSLG